jgi:hypothetical protein
MTHQYTSNTILNDRISTDVVSIESGTPTEHLTAKLKKEPTGILLPADSHSEIRFRPGAQVRTYTRLDPHDQPVDETWGGELIDDAVILRNVESVKYDEGHELAGREVRGTYQDDGVFVVDPSGLMVCWRKFLLDPSGSDVLHNEWVSDLDYVRGKKDDSTDKGAYGVEPTTEWQIALKLFPVYFIRITDEIGDVSINNPYQDNDVVMNAGPGDYVAIGTKVKDGSAKVISVQVVDKKWAEQTYVDLEAYLEDLKE